jgi:ferredoxin
VRIKVEVLDNCVGCGICWTICPKGVLTGRLRDRAYVVNEAVCSGCFSCQLNCPYSAIVITLIDAGVKGQENGSGRGSPYRS